MCVTRADSRMSVTLSTVIDEFIIVAIIIVSSSNRRVELNEP
jgi:hypothetical protein